MKISPFGTNTISSISGQNTKSNTKFTNYNTLLVKLEMTNLIIKLKKIDLCNYTNIYATKLTYHDFSISCNLDTNL